MYVCISTLLEEDLLHNLESRISRGGAIALFKYLQSIVFEYGSSLTKHKDIVLRRGSLEGNNALLCCGVLGAKSFETLITFDWKLSFRAIGFVRVLKEGIHW